MINAAILEEYTTITAQIRERLFPDTQPSGALAWIAAKSLHFDPIPLSKALSRDPDDHVFIATALAAGAEYVVTQDRDLLTLEKPFGVAMITPVQLVRRLRL